MLEGLNLEIEEIGIVTNSKIEINKINVVGGVNSSGKSTVSKLLYCFLKSISKSRKEYISEAILPVINEFINIMENPNPYGDHGLKNRFTIDDDLDDMIGDYEKAKEKFDKIKDSFKLPPGIFREMMEEIESYIAFLQGDYEKYYPFLLKSLFKSESLLTMPCNSKLYDGSFISSVNYQNINKHYSFYREKYFEGEESVDVDTDNFICDLEGSFELLPEVFYIDSVSIFDLVYYAHNDLYDVYEEEGTNDFFEYKGHIDYLLKSLLDYSENIDEDVEEKIIAVEEKIHGLVKGFNSSIEDILPNFKSYFGTSLYMYHSDEITANISSGVQQIGIIEELLARRELVPGTFLIIDEPEVNLHPEWQFKFAEILILLAKELDITIYLNSHSPMFIEAIEVLTQYYDLEEYTNFYLTEKLENEDKYNFVKIDCDNLFDLYDNLAKPYEAIEVFRLKAEYKKGNY